MDEVRGRPLDSFACTPMFVELYRNGFSLCTVRTFQATIQHCNMGGTEGFQRAIADVRLFSLPFGRSRRSETPAQQKRTMMQEKPASASPA